MRGSIDKHPTLVRKKRSNHFADDGIPMSATTSNAQGSIKKGKLIKGIRTKSSVSGIGMDQQVSQAFPVPKPKPKIGNQSSSLLDDSLGAKLAPERALEGV